MLYINKIPVTIEHFPDNTQKINFDIDCIRQVDYPNVAFILWKYENDSEFVTLSYLVNHLRNNNINIINLNMPYVPNARFDRTTDKSEVFTLKYFAQMLNALQFDSVTVLDPHSYVSEALINHLSIDTPTKLITQILNQKHATPDNTILFFPDEGAMKRYNKMLQHLNMEYVFGIKQRDWKTGKIENLQLSGNLDNIKNKNILIIDDICSRGGTFIHSAKALQKHHPKTIDLFISHCENTILQGEIPTSDFINHVYTTDSIFTKQHEKITVFPL